MKSGGALIRMKSAFTTMCSALWDLRVNQMASEAQT